MTARPGMPDLPAPDGETAEGWPHWTEVTITVHAKAAYDAGRKAEREAVVEWLREDEDEAPPTERYFANSFAAAIARGEHLPGADS